ncbi:hypothetical protein ASPSYDRAFT_62822 [Aspergillus sydowii CBS 593.65]|uniref:Zn(2)-C6 fungal-type domain-containing protein n=1 Tax=Aspergillus sydowii CBS 593.65 TaxID=1036612 RepID=A0A1L9SZK9_9EURO|nr:uncharacterized protein ASPSYDRAFT_62822 [Aspergillus sydowii CBS 593.65]OJJ52511.1 hypothetical protein ASPSYDRAFT_62822 [Aspergillus sydowii CBS 593.65]
MASGKEDEQLRTITPGPGPLRENWVLKKNKKSSSACLPCKKAKRKCTGRPAPCKACQHHRISDGCVFNEQLDLRRKVAVQKTAGDLEKHQRILYSLLGCLRRANDEKVSHILQAIRDGGDAMSNIDILSKMLLVEGSPIEEATDASDSSSEYNIQCNRPSRITVGRLFPSKPWTTITDDDHLVSSLISLYFTWDHPLMQVVNQEMFLRDMIAGDLASTFCSPVLVNSILAVSSIYSNYPETYAVPGDATSRGQNFFREAEKCWRAEEGRPSLANIQALILMSHNLKLQGKDNSSWLHLRQAVQIGQDIGLFKFPRSKHCEWDRMPEHVKRASSQTAWAIFILNMDMCLEYGRMAHIGVPRLSLDKLHEIEQDAVWVPYRPRSNHIDLPREPAFLHHVMAGLAELANTLADIQNLFLVEAPDMSIHQIWEKASQLYDRVEVYRKGLRDPVMIDDHPVPQILYLHIKCHHVLITLLGLVLELQGSEYSLGPIIREQVKSNQIIAAKQIAQYLQLYRKHYGLAQTPNLFYSPTKTSSLTLLALADNIITDNIFRNLHQVLLSFSSRFPAARETIYKIDAIHSSLSKLEI